MDDALADTGRTARLHRSTRWLLCVFVVGLVLTSAMRTSARLGTLHADAISPSILRLGLMLGLVLMMGNIIVTQAWIFMAERARNRDVMRFAGRALNWADVFFTAPGIYLVVISGLLLLGRREDHAGWLVATEISFVLAGPVWFLFLVPMQNRLAVRAGEARLDSGFYATLHRWYWLGLLATAVPVDGRSAMP